MKPGTSSDFRIPGENLAPAATIKHNTQTVSKLEYKESTRITRFIDNPDFVRVNSKAARTYGYFNNFMFLYKQHLESSHGIVFFCQIQYNSSPSKANPRFIEITIEMQYKTTLF